ncbi:MAG: undecaprenyldiphospho-muramoylpentapeptide beta-N-acetylglucosaminyltransferase, partial [Bacteroidota bacterium]
MSQPKRILLSGGGTGGHIYPAIAIAQQFEKELPGCEILFVGAKGAMEEQLVPKAGYTLKTLPISGLYRQLTMRNIIRNLQLPYKLVASRFGARRILKGFSPDIAIGTGGYASYPILSAAAGSVPVVALQEQNAWPGMVNRRLAPVADVVFLGNPDARNHLVNDNLINSGNPIRSTILNGNAINGRQHWNFQERPTLLITGGSLGAKTLNESVEQQLDTLALTDVNVLWQCGKLYYERLKRLQLPENVRLTAFIDNMPDTLAMADLVVCRAGASTISELIALEKPSILVPSPNVAGDHQTANAKSLSKHNAAEMVHDNDARQHLIDRALSLLKEDKRRRTMRINLQAMQHRPAAEVIVEELLRLYLVCT